ncbi:hypothetical protein LL912_12445 [Niabella sp. CC-SYL272]|uniref:DUF6908 domain-containing protein n=1 Tax=Niabella agricola TaxID=2891571 RepID=UPI001F3344E7|nr:hypothetical protein [Niabella agricola]MCF3109582.1 hypothetical protein [Niabella agricola]
MKQLNEKAAAVFGTLMDAMTRGCLQVFNKPHLPLALDNIYDARLPLYGPAEVYHLCHHFIQDGHVVEDPSMFFAVVDNRQKSGGMDQLIVIPVSLRHDGRYEANCVMNDDEFVSFDEQLQNRHVDFAESWMQNIVRHGYLDRIAQDTPVQLDEDDTGCEECTAF